MKIHFLSNSPKVNTGFSVVTKNLALGLMKLGHEVICTGIQTSYIPEEYFGIKTLPLATDQPEDIQFMNNVMAVEPDVIIYVGGMYSPEDPIHLTKMFPNPFCKAVQWVYCPVEGSRLPKRMVADLNEVVNRGGKVIAQTMYGYNEMKKAGVNVGGYIYHGFDDSIFKKIDLSKIWTKSEVANEQVSFLKWFDMGKGKEGEMSRAGWTRFDISIVDLKEQLEMQFKGKFVFLHIGANHALRKRMERLIKAYSILVKESKQLRDNTRLHLHTVPVSMTGINLLDLVEEFDLKDNISFSFGKDYHGWSDTALNILYNMADVGVSASSSEGFGLDTLQSMAVGNPYIAPDCTAFTELIADLGKDGKDGKIDLDKSRGLLVNLAINDMMLQDGSYRSLVDITDLALKMKKIYTDKELRLKLGNNAEKWAKQYTWDRICAGWDKSLRDWKEIKEIRETKEKKEIEKKASGKLDAN